MAARRLGMLMTCFEALRDPRVERTRKHSLLHIVAIALCAVIGGAAFSKKAPPARVIRCRPAS
jgi:hypothetical protein